METQENKFAIAFSLVFREKDVFNEGCDPDSGITEFLEGEDQLFFEAPTIPALLGLVKKSFNVDDNGLLLNSCEEIGRLDVQTYTKTIKGRVCSYEKHKAGFTAGEFPLWLNCYTGTVIRVAAPVDLIELNK